MPDKPGATAGGCSSECRTPVTSPMAQAAVRQMLIVATRAPPLRPIAKTTRPKVSPSAAVKASASTDTLSRRMPVSRLPTVAVAATSSGLVQVLRGAKNQDCLRPQASALAATSSAIGTITA